MNIKRLILAIGAGFLFYFITDFIIHGVWMVQDYKQTAELWRSEADMQARMPWMFLGHLLFATAFVVLWAKGFADWGCLSCAAMFGLFMGLFLQGNTIIGYVVSPVPPSIPIKWFFSGLIQTTLLGILTF